LRAIAGNPQVDPALNDLYRGDIFHLRAALEAARVHADDRFFSVIAPEPAQRSF
jgi:hypothetical protein